MSPQEGFESDGQPFEIETPGLIAGVRGTKFRLDSPEEGQPPLLKTFEGAVTGYVGFEAVEVAEDQQFDVLAGVAPLVLDTLDEFNLQRDLFLNIPRLSLRAVPSLTESRTLSITGETDAPSVQTPTATIPADNCQFQFDVNLSSGLNLIEVQAQWVEGGPKTSLVIPVIRQGRDVLLFLDEPRLLAGRLARLSGLASPGTTLTVSGLARGYQYETGADGRFSLLVSLGRGQNLLTLTARNAFGETTSIERSIMVE